MQWRRCRKRLKRVLCELDLGWNDLMCGYDKGNCVIVGYWQRSGKSVWGKKLGKKLAGKALLIYLASFALFNLFSARILPQVNHCIDIVILFAQ